MRFTSKVDMSDITYGQKANGLHLQRELSLAYSETYLLPAILRADRWAHVLLLKLL